MKTRKVLFLLAVLAALALSMACTIPDYELDFSYSIGSYSSNPMPVNYTLRNTGSKDLSNVSVEVTVDAQVLAGGWTAGSAWTSSTDISEGRSATGTVYVPLAMGSSYSMAYAGMSSAV